MESDLTVPPTWIKTWNANTSIPQQWSKRFAVDVRLLSFLPVYDMNCKLYINTRTRKNID